MSVNRDWVIDISGLSKSFDEKLVVDNVGLKVAKGDVYGFLGPNGSGKTTTIRMICGLLIPDSGKGTCLGYDLIKDSNIIKLNVGYMTQKFSLYEDLSIEENLKFVARLFQLDNQKKRVQDAIDRLGIGKQRKKQLAGMLSGGWKQRLALAAATIHEPKLLLLDEPTAGVDPKARREFWDEIHRMASEGVTTLVSTHYMDEAERCNKLAYIAYGKLLVNGTCDEVIDSTDLQTWQASGGDLNKLAKQLESESKIEQVAAFGQRLHVSAKSKENLKSILKPYMTSEFKWKQINPSLEDVFIHLMQTQEDNFS
jgi:ABC-2 type transport system ATP-binding protein